MYYVENDWILIAIAYCNRAKGQLIYLISGIKESDFNFSRISDGEYILRNSYNIAEIRDKDMIQALKNAGISTTQPLKINKDFTFSLLATKDSVGNDKKTIKLYPNEVNIVSKDGSFESIYHTCDNCRYPVTVEGNCKLNQTDLDNLNYENGEVASESAIISYKCGNCGHEVCDKTIKDVIIRKTTDKPITGTASKILGREATTNEVDRDLNFEPILRPRMGRG